MLCQHLCDNKSKRAGLHKCNSVHVSINKSKQIKSCGCKEENMSNKKRNFMNKAEVMSNKSAGINYKLGAVAVYGGRIVSTGCNSPEVVNILGKNVSRHAEMDCVSKLIRSGYWEKQREKKNRPLYL